ncbi:MULTISPECIES: hypothetical protein [unclassified Sphingopyxis]|uniref:hypothetical protein n=1 Tax=unclassified Sphingopyxis TaxID=2614943 RepID=UPI0012E38B11|nr:MULTISPECIES: hypothetical protein [unclassified Sphingopyxis]
MRAAADHKSRRAVPTGASQDSVFFGKTGAGEGIRTLDPNLGKKLLQIPQSFFFYAKVRKSKHLLTSAYDNLS